MATVKPVKDNSTVIRIDKTLKTEAEKYAAANIPKTKGRYIIEAAVLEFLCRKGWLDERKMKLANVPA